MMLPTYYGVPCSINQWEELQDSIPDDDRIRFTGHGILVRDEAVSGDLEDAVVEWARANGLTVRDETGAAVSIKNKAG